jgi:hypothetical protein
MIRERTRIICNGAKSVCLLAILAVDGCVMQSTYDAALKEGMTTKAELAQAKDEAQMLARQVGDMERLNADVVREAEAASAALGQAKADAELKRQHAEQQIAALQQRVAQATKQQRSLQYELTVAKENAAALQELIDVYQKKVRDGAAVAATSRTPEPEVHKPFDPATIPVPQDLPPSPAVAQPAPTPTTPPAPAQTPTASRPKAVPPPQDDDWLSSIKHWLMSLWHSVFS